jgi:hypothetical protein
VRIIQPGVGTYLVLVLLILDNRCREIIYIIREITGWRLGAALCRGEGLLEVGGSVVVIVGGGDRRIEGELSEFRSLEWCSSAIG